MYLTIGKWICSLLGKHKLKVKRRINEDIQELYCSRCRESFAIQHSTQSFLPLDIELINLHNDILLDQERYKLIKIAPVDPTEEHIAKQKIRDRYRIVKKQKGDDIWYTLQEFKRYDYHYEHRHCPPPSYEPTWQNIATSDGNPSIVSVWITEIDKKVEELYKANFPIIETVVYP